MSRHPLGGQTVYQRSITFVPARRRLVRVSAGCVCWVCLMALFVGPSDLSGDTIWVRGKDNPISGKILARNAEQVSVRVFKDGEFDNVIDLPLANVEHLLVNIDADRLSKLTPDRPGEYRDYAEELASQKTDLSARDLARRLYLIAAANSDGSVRGSALAGLIAIAETDTQRHRMEVLRFLVIPGESSISLGKEPTKRRSLTGPQRQLTLKLIHAIRKEESDTATKLLDSPDNRAVFSFWSDECRLEEFDRMARVNRPNKSQLGKLLRIELQVTDPGHDLNSPSNRKLNWGDYATQVSGNLSVLPSFDNVTRFNPRKTIFRDGEWVEP